MRRNELDYILNVLLDFHKDVSDIVFTVDKPLQVEVGGELMTVPIDPPVDRLTPFQTEMMALNIIAGSPRLTDDLIRTGSCDSSYTLSDRARFRINIFCQRGHYSIVLRKLNAQIPTLATLNLPEVISQAGREKTGLVLVTGATGSGKSTTLASLIEEINQQKAIHVITLEDPIEFIYAQKKATINQRELGTDFNTFASGLRAALRQAPKVILVGEMRDRATVEIALNAAETGHLVFSTLHTIDCGQTINRILGMFEPEAAAGIPWWKSWDPIFAQRRALCLERAKERAFTKSSKRARPSAGARSIIPAWMLSSAGLSRKKPLCCWPASGATLRAGSISSAKAVAK
jgi:twitching motility protein PilT